MYESEFIFEIQSGGRSTTKFFDCVRFYTFGAETREPKNWISSVENLLLSCLVIQLKARGHVRKEEAKES